MTKREKRYHSRKKILRQRLGIVAQTEGKVHWAELVNFIEADDDTELTECPNCGSLWGISSEEYNWQQCGACGWQPGQLTEDEMEDDIEYFLDENPEQEKY